MFKEFISFIRARRAFYIAEKMAETGKFDGKSQRIRIDLEGMQQYAAQKGVGIEDLTPKERADYIDPF